jgi:hypothetical protein
LTDIDKDYLIGRKMMPSGRPQAMLFSENPGILDEGYYIPQGEEFKDFIILSDHNRKQIQFKPNRIETKVRTVNGRMRSYHIADKLSISTSWDNLPSRASSADLAPDESGTLIVGANDLVYTVDGGAGGVDLLNWYENHQGSFWVFLAYDKFNNFETRDGELEIVNDYSRMGQYNQIVEVFFEDFQYDVVARGRTTHDFWNISLSLEEV